jgi:hypothetical protein
VARKAGCRRSDCEGLEQTEKARQALNAYSDAHRDSGGSNCSDPRGMKIRDCAFSGFVLLGLDCGRRKL